MKVLEYQAKRLLRRFGVSIPHGAVAYTADEAEAAAHAIGGAAWRVKAQVQHRNQGDSGGIRATSPEAVGRATVAMLDSPAIARPSGGHAVRVARVLVEEEIAAGRDLSVSVSVDSGRGRVLVEMASAGAPVARLVIDPAAGFAPRHGRRLAAAAGLGPGEGAALGASLAALYEAFTALDATRIEVDPLRFGSEGWLALDLSLAIDVNAFFRQPEIADLAEDEEEADEAEARRSGLNYVRLDGSIGCLVNGAGLALATMDTIGLYGGRAANFLDVGGGATRERVAGAFRLLLSDPNVEGVLVNIFGGIMRCDAIAEGIVAAARESGVQIPLVVRLEGTNADLGTRILGQSGLPIMTATSLAEAAEQVVAAVRQAA
jgi:succinyl-CoA synthetase beta subunit